MQCSAVQRGDRQALSGWQMVWTGPSSKEQAGGNIEHFIKLCCVCWFFTILCRLSWLESVQIQSCRKRYLAQDWVGAGGVGGNDYSGVFD